jgi:hypothetical protein
MAIVTSCGISSVIMYLASESIVLILTSEFDTLKPLEDYVDTLRWFSKHWLDRDSNSDMTMFS